jgi:biopolymer transport protein ExbB
MSIGHLIAAGGFAMYPLLLCSLVTWVVIFERLWSYRKLDSGLHSFHLEALNTLLRGDRDALRALCQRNPEIPTSRLVSLALERQASKDARLRWHWADAVERRRLMINQEMRRSFWMLGTIGSAAPFIGLFGTVIGILGAFGNMAQTGSGGFNVVASAISEALIATAAGIVVAVIAVLAFNSFQTRWSSLVLIVRVHTQELVEMLDEQSHLTSADWKRSGAESRGT